MVSTRLMSSSVGGADVASGCESGGAGRVTRHSSALPGSSSPHAGPSRSGTCLLALLPAPKTHSTGLLDLPVEVLEKIFGYLGYKTVSLLRTVNPQFNTICSGILNSTFQRLQNQMLHRFQAIKAKMPRRESARRSHPLACESDIIETLHMRLSLLQMTFGKHIERKHCCFFPGEILDEVYSILLYLKTTTKLARPYKVTDELFDLTTMAMEYFKEHIEPNLPEITYFGTDFFDITATFSPGESSKSYLCLDSPPPAGCVGGAGGGVGGGGSGGGAVSNYSYLEESLPPSPPPPQSNMVLRKRIHRIKQGMKKYNDQLASLRSDLRGCKRKAALQQKQIVEQQKQIAEQQKQTVEYANRLDDYDKKNEETSRKFQTLLQELNKCKTELQYWRSRSPAVPPLCGECGAALRVSPDPSAEQWAADLSTETIDDATASGSGQPSTVAGVIMETPITDLNANKPDSKAAIAKDGKTESSKMAKDSKTESSKLAKDSKTESSKLAKDNKPESSKAAKDSKCNTETKSKDKAESSKSREGSKGLKRELERDSKKDRSESSGEDAGASPARRRPSGDAAGTSPARRRPSGDAAGTPERKKRRLTRPRKL